MLPSWHNSTSSQSVRSLWSEACAHSRIISTVVLGTPCPVRSPQWQDLADHVYAVADTCQGSTQSLFRQAVRVSVGLCYVEEVDAAVKGLSHCCPGSDIVNLAPLIADVPHANPMADTDNLFYRMRV